VDPVLTRFLAAMSLASATAVGAPSAHSAVPAATMAADTNPESQQWSFHHEAVLGTSLDLRIEAENREIARNAEAAILRRFDADERIFSSFQPQSEFSRWQQTRFVPVAISPELFAVLTEFDVWRKRTDGALDPSVEAATRLWKQCESEGRKPTEAEIAATLEAIQQAHWSLDHEHKTATRLSDTPLALASFVKSWIADRAANEALNAGASGVLVNVGGDMVVRGALAQQVDIVDPRHVADNDPSLDSLRVVDRAVATSGVYRRGFTIEQQLEQQAPEYSHLFHPATAQPTAHILSATVIAPQAATAGALATALAVMPVDAGRKLIAQQVDAEALVVLADGSEIRTPGWSRYSLSHPSLGIKHNAAFVHPAATSATNWNPAYELTIGLELPQSHDARYRRPYLAAWIEDADHFPVRTLALWSGNPRWIPDLKQWYRDDQMRSLAEGTDISRTVGSATRPAGKYTLQWDGKDNTGHYVKAGSYSVVIEAVREHGGYQIERHTIDFNGHAYRTELPAGAELGKISLDYKKR